MIKRIFATLLLITISLSMFSGCSFFDNLFNTEEDVDYLTSDLTKYISFSEDYKNINLNINIAKPHYDIDVEVSKIAMLCKDKPTEAWVKGSTGNHKINPGDVVYIWYRGYIIEDGKEVYMDGMSNIGGTYSNKYESYPLEIGSNSFVPGFELGLVGQMTSDFDDLEIIKEGNVLETEASVAYISYRNSTTYGKQERVDLTLSSAEIDAKYGVGFYEKLLSMDIGVKEYEYRTTIDEKEVTYTNLTVDIVTKNEDKGLKVEGIYFPYDYYYTELQNADAVFYVYFDKIDCYYEETPVLDDEYVKAKIESKDIDITLDEFNAYEGDTLVEKYNSYAKDVLDKTYEAEYNRMVSEAAWEYILSIANIEKYPTKNVDAVYYEYAVWLNHLYTTTGGQIYNPYYGTQTYTNFNTFANAYLGIDSHSEYYFYGTEAWRYCLYDDISKDAVKEKMAIFYILRAENLLPDEATFESKIEEVKEKCLDWYNNEYLSDTNYKNGIIINGITVIEDKIASKKDVTDKDDAVEIKDVYIKDTKDEKDLKGEINELTLEKNDIYFCYAAVVDYYSDYKAYKISGNDENYFVDQAYRNILIENALKWANVITLDDKK